MRNCILLILMAGLSLGLGGCVVAPYEHPTYVETIHSAAPGEVVTTPPAYQPRTVIIERRVPVAPPIGLSLWLRPDHSHGRYYGGHSRGYNYRGHDHGRRGGDYNSRNYRDRR